MLYIFRKRNSFCLPAFQVWIEAEERLRAGQLPLQCTEGVDDLPQGRSGMLGGEFLGFSRDVLEAAEQQVLRSHMHDNPAKPNGAERGATSRLEAGSASSTSVRIARQSCSPDGSSSGFRALTCPNLPAAFNMRQWLGRAFLPVTAARPRRIFTVFRFPSNRDASYRSCAVKVKVPEKDHKRSLRLNRQRMPSPKILHLFYSYYVDFFGQRFFTVRICQPYSVCDATKEGASHAVVLPRIRRTFTSRD